MANIKEHMRDTKRLLGEEMREVHLWLDELADLFPPPAFLDYHRSFRHNSYGLAYCRARWGTKGELAARIHLLKDNYWPVEKYPLKIVMPKSNELLLYYNNLDNFEISVYPSIYSAWKREGKSLISMATEE